MTDNPDRHVAVNIDSDAPGDEKHTSMVIDSETGDSVQLGDEMSADAQEFMDAVGDAFREAQDD